jgi:erythronate-4-phosphate dehydrogenase
MKIIADENIPYVKEAFGALGEVTLLPGRGMDAASVSGADVLLVRSVTKVNEALIEGSRIGFVGTATIGTDHIDRSLLESRAIGFASAFASNANSVAEYVMSALLNLAGREKFRLRDKIIGVIGVGNIGSRVVRMAEALGMKVLQNDPPLERKTRDPKFLPIDDLFEADILTFHTPLTMKGLDATHHMVNKPFLDRMKTGSILLNTSRGAVIETSALYKAIDRRHISFVVLDVWENEPHIDTSLLEKATLATPHIAGYSLDGKANGTELIYQALCKFLGKEPKWSAKDSLPPPSVPQIEVEVEGRDDEDVLREVAEQVYNIAGDDAALREILKVAEAERGKFFDQKRKEYPIRREFFNTTLILRDGSKDLQRKCVALGFQARRIF